MEIMLLPPPSAHSARLLWEARWEHELRQSYSGASATEILNVIFGLARQGNDTTVMSQEFMARELLIAQAHYAKELPLALCCFTMPWMSMSSQKREELVLDAICGVIDSDISVGLLRMYCPDSTLRHLCSQNGTVFLGMVQRFLDFDAATSHTKFVYFPNEHVDRVCGEMRLSEKALERIRVFRATFIGRVLWKTLRLFVSCRLV